MQSPPAGQQSHFDCARMTERRYGHAHAPSVMFVAAVSRKIRYPHLCTSLAVRIPNQPTNQPHQLV